MKIPNIIKKITIESGNLSQWLKGKMVIEDIDLGGGEWLSFQKSANEKTYIPEVTICISDSPYEPKFSCMYWSKEKDVKLSGYDGDRAWLSETTKENTLNDFHERSEELMEAKAMSIIKEEGVLSVEIINFIKTGEIYPDFSLIVKRKKYMKVKK